ncbi:MAG: lactate racemase domain-containing protein [Pirellulaceae bacterium]
MQTDFSIGPNPAGIMSLNTPDGLRVITANVGQNMPIVDLELAVQEALANPIDFVPLSQTVFPGDTVAIAVGPEVPATNELVMALLKCFEDTQVSMADITVVVPYDGETAGRLKEAIASEFSSVGFQVHDSHDDEALAYLAASAAGDPIMVNRTLYDADIVIPVTTVRHDGMLGYNGGFDGLIPEYSDAATQLRVRGMIAAVGETDDSQRRGDIRETAWLLGIQLSVRVVPDPNGGVVSILAGMGVQLDVAAEEDFKQACSVSPEQAPLVIASVSGSAGADHWRSLANAAYAASQFVQANGVIVLLSDLNEPVGPATRFLADLDDESARRRVMESQESDQIAAMQLLRLRGVCRIYFCCGGRQDELEEIGIGFAADINEIENLSAEYDQCVVLHGADRVIPVIA